MSFKVYLYDRKTQTYYSQVNQINELSKELKNLESHLNISRVAHSSVDDKEYLASTYETCCVVTGFISGLGCWLAAGAYQSPISCCLGTAACVVNQKYIAHLEKQKSDAEKKIVDKVIRLINQDSLKLLNMVSHLTITNDIYVIEIPQISDRLTKQHPHSS